MKKLLKTLLVFSISTIAIYMIFTLNFLINAAKNTNLVYLVRNIMI